MIQLSSILEDFSNPSLTNTVVEKKKLEDFDFPLLFKICPMLGFNISALKKVGYASTVGYFKGESMFNKSMIGWGGHKNGTFEALASVEEVYEKVKSHEVGDIIDYIKINFQSGKSKKFTSDSVDINVKRVNYPRNCFTLNLANDSDVQGNGITDMYFKLKKVKNNETKEATQRCKMQNNVFIFSSFRFSFPNAIGSQYLLVGLEGIYQIG